MKTIVQNILLLICGVLLALLIAEGIARLIYTKPWYDRLLEEQTHTDCDWDWDRLNSQGLRGKNYSNLKPLHSHRVLILGDSFTFGAGVDDDNATFSALLEKQLNFEFSSKGETIEILNGGIIASLTPQWVDLLLRIQDSFQPDVILIVFFLRDGTKTGAIKSFFGPIRKEIESKNTDSFFYQYSYLIRLYLDYQDRLYLAKKYSLALNEAYLGSPEQTQEWENAKNNILKIKAIAKNRKSKIGFVVFPVLVELNNHYPFNDICKKVISFTTENNIPTHNLLPAFIGKNGPDLWISGFDQHPNPVAHKIAAESIQPFLKQLIQQ